MKTTKILTVVLLKEPLIKFSHALKNIQMQDYLSLLTFFSLYILFSFCDLSHFCNIDAPFSFQNLFYTYLAQHWKKVSVINVLKLDIVLFCICLFCAIHH